MNKNILIVILVVVSLLSVVYAFFQQAAAGKAMMVAEMNHVLAEKAKKEADANAMEAGKQAEIAREEAERARIAIVAMQKLLAECNGRK